MFQQEKSWDFPYFYRFNDHVVKKYFLIGINPYKELNTG